MNKKSGILFGVLLASASGLMFYFVAFPLMSQQADQQTSPFSNTQNPEMASTVANDIDTCVANPTLDCDQEMLQISKFCQGNKDPSNQFCSDPRVQAYLDQRGLTRPTVNTGS